MKNTVAVIGTAYPGAEPFLGRYLDSLESQKFRGFDLLLVNDGCKDLGKFLAGRRLSFRELSAEGSIAANRGSAVRYARSKGYSSIIFTDCDDFYSVNRVEVCLGLLRRYDIVVNDQTLVDRRGKLLCRRYFSHRLKDMQRINRDDIIDRNLFGFSNTALRAACLSRNPGFDDGVTAVDWLVFTRLLLADKRAVFTNRTVSFYRQHGGNTAGFAACISMKSLLKSVAVKAQHYRKCARFCGDFGHYRTAFRRLEEILEKPGGRNAYLKLARAKTQRYPLWWETACYPEGI